MPGSMTGPMTGKCGLSELVIEQVIEEVTLLLRHLAKSSIAFPYPPGLASLPTDTTPHAPTSQPLSQRA